MGKKEREFEGRAVCAWGDEGKACFARNTALGGAAKVGMDILYDNDTTMLLVW